MSPPSPSQLSAETVRRAVTCPSCGARSQLLTRHPPGIGEYTQPAPSIVRFRCTNQMARAHRSPTDTELHSLIDAPR